MLPGDCIQHADLQLPSHSWSEVAGGQGWGLPATPQGYRKQRCAPTRQSTEWPPLDEDVVTTCHGQIWNFSAFTHQEVAALGTSSLLIQRLVQPIVKSIGCITHWPVQQLNMAGKDWVPSTCSLRYLSCNFFQHPSYEWLGSLILYLPVCTVRAHRLDSSGLLFEPHLTSMAAFPASLFLLEFFLLESWSPWLHPLSHLKSHQSPVQYINTSFTPQPNWDANTVFKVFFQLLLQILHLVFMQEEH